MQIIDLHCHVDLMPSMMKFANETAVEGIGILAVTTTPKAFEKEIEMLHPFENIRVAVGLHPQLISERFCELSLIEKYIGGNKFIGEVGLDFNKPYYASKNKQMEAFDSIISCCSHNGGKVISIHSVFADKATLDILEKHECTANNKCILHWFSGTLSQLERAIEMGCYFSVNGAMIKSTNGQKLLRNIPLDRLLVETDAPFVGNLVKAQELRTELSENEKSLASIFGANGIDRIHNNSRYLFGFQ